MSTTLHDFVSKEIRSWNLTLNNEIQEYNNHLIHNAHLI